jgi:hypothetical protein
MRPALSALIAASFLASNLLASAAGAAESCARPADKSAFDVAGLKSQLMVTAIACQAEDKYNAFIVRFRSELQTQERALNGYFSRSFGRRAQQQHDNYITSLANSQSENGIQSGTLFCQRNIGLFDEVMALPDSKALPTYAAGKSLVQPISLTECPATPVKSTKPARTRTAKR